MNFRCVVLLALMAAGTAAASDVFVFEEDLRFGADRDEDVYIWSGGHTRVVADDRGHMYLADVGSDRVLEFGPDGSFIREVMSKGQGPGEVLGLFSFDLTDSGAVALGKTGGITITGQRLDSSLKYVDGFTKTLILESIVTAPNGKAFAGFYVTLDQKQGVRRFKTSLFDADLKPIKDFDDKTGPLPDRSRIREPGYWVETLGDNLKRSYGGVHVFTFDQQGRLYSADNAAYKVTRWNESKVEQVYQRKTKPIPMTEAHLNAYVESATEQLTADPFLADIVTETVIRRAVERSEPPPVKRAVFALLVTEDNHLLVVRDVDLASRRNMADVFASDGSFKGSVQVPDHGFVTLIGGGYMPKMQFNNGYAYTVSIDEEGDQYVVRYKIVRK